MNCVQWFQQTYPRVLAWHTPNGELRNKFVAEKLKRMGVLPGVGDWLAFPVGKPPVCFELKKPKGGVQSEDQQRFETAWQTTGGLYVVVKTLDEFKDHCVRLVGPLPVEPPAEVYPWQLPSGDSNPSPGDLAVQSGASATSVV